MAARSVKATRSLSSGVRQGKTTKKLISVLSESISIFLACYYGPLFPARTLWTVKMKIKVQGNTLKPDVNSVRVTLTKGPNSAFTHAVSFTFQRERTLLPWSKPISSVQSSFWLIPFQTLLKALGSTHSFPIRLSTKKAASLSKLVNIGMCEEPYDCPGTITPHRTILQPWSRQGRELIREPLRGLAA